MVGSSAFVSSLHPMSILRHATDFSKKILVRLAAVDAWLDTTDKKVCGLYLWSDCTLDGFFLNSDFMEAKADEVALGIFRKWSYVS
jgi:hypothetical protein